MNFRLADHENLICEAKSNWWLTLVPHIQLMVIGVGFITIIFAFIHCVTKKLCVTDTRIFGRTGFCGMKKFDYPLDKLNVRISEFDDAIFDNLRCGTIEIYTPSGKYIFKHILEPEDFESSLLRQMKVYNENKTRL